MEFTDNLNILEFKPLVSPEELKSELPLSPELAKVVVKSRAIIQRIIAREDLRSLVVVGPCSLHDREASLEYARRLKELQDSIGQRVLLVMRAYFEKPRTSVGWKGMLYDPHLDESDQIEEGFRQARGLLLEITKIGLPAATEILDPIVPQYLADLVSWAAIGARTTESQIHRQMASGLSMPIGFKNATDGNLDVAVQALKASRVPHSFLGISRQGMVSIACTRGNSFGHLVLRGGKNKPNYGSEYVAFAETLLRKNGLPPAILIDCSHDNSRQNHRLQRDVLHDVRGQLKAGCQSIIGVMLESFLEEGRQSIPTNLRELKFGVSLTDQCLGWEETAELIQALAAAH